VEVSAPAGDPHQELFEEIDALNRKGFISRFRTNPLKPDLRQHQRRVGYFLREWSIEIDSLIAAARHIRGAVERQHRRRQRRNDRDQRPGARVAIELHVAVLARQRALTAAEVNMLTASEALPAKARRLARLSIPTAFQNTEPFSSANTRSSSHKAFTIA